MAILNDPDTEIALSQRELSVLLEISRVVTSSLPMSNMFEVVHAYLSQIMSYKMGSFYVVDKNTFKLKALVGLDDDAFDVFHDRVGTNFLIKRIKATGRPWRSSLIFEGEKIKKHPYYLQVLQPLDIHYTIGAPMRDGDQLLGSIHLGRTAADGDFTEKELRMLEMTTNMLAQAVKNIKIKNSCWELENQVADNNDRSVPGAGHGYHGQGHVEEMEEDLQLQLLGSVSALLTRELRNPISSLKMSFYSLARNVASGTLAQKELEHMDRSIKKMDVAVRFLASLSQDLRLHQEWLSINELLDEVLKIIGPTLDPDVIIVKDYARLPKLYLDREKMHTVFGNLIENAIDAMPCGGRLRITTTESQGRVYVVLEDTGLGIEKGIRDNLFEPFISTKPNGIGLGLTVCNRIVGSHGGRIRMRNKSDKGTEVCVDLPVPTAAHT